MIQTTDWIALMQELGAEFAKRAARHDEDDSFVVDNYGTLKARGAFKAGIPAELGGHGASHTDLVGEMENQLITAQLAHTSMVQLAATQKPGPEATAATVCRRTIVVNAVTATVQKALEVAGGAGFYRTTGLERAFRDIQAARYHPIQEKPQTRLTGRVLLGLDIDG
jgi:alkylation response protein AidB-like acyl-CoA dehydrogenase